MWPTIATNGFRLVLSIASCFSTVSPHWVIIVTQCKHNGLTYFDNVHEGCIQEASREVKGGGGVEALSLQFLSPPKGAEI